MATTSQGKVNWKSLYISIYTQMQRLVKRAVRLL